MVARSPASDTLWAARAALYLQSPIRMNLVIRTAANGFIVSESGQNFALAEEQHVFTTADALARHVREYAQKHLPSSAPRAPEASMTVPAVPAQAVSTGPLQLPDGVPPPPEGLEFFGPGGDELIAAVDAGKLELRAICVRNDDDPPRKWREKRPHEHFTGSSPVLFYAGVREL